MTTPSFNGLLVLALESRRGKELSTLIATYGGRPLEAPALREVPIESNTEARAFAAALRRWEFDIVICLTGVGTRALTNVVDQVQGPGTFATALAKVRVVARGPKPLAVLREMQVPVWLTAPEPNTWRELLAALDARSVEQPLAGARVAVQEYGVPSTELVEALRERGARVVPVPVYQWALPEDIEPLKKAVTAVAQGSVDVVILTTRVQLVHLWEVAEQMHLEGELKRGLGRAVLASIGPTTSDELQHRGLAADLEASHPKLGFLVREAAERSGDLLREKRSHEDDASGAAGTGR